MAFDGGELDAGVFELFPQVDQIAVLAVADGAPVGKDPNQHNPSVLIGVTQSPGDTLGIFQMKSDALPPT